MFLLRASLLDEEVPLLISVEVVKQLGSAIDVAQKTIELRNFQNAKVPHLTMDLKPEHVSSLQKRITTQMWEQAHHNETRKKISIVLLQCMQGTETFWDRLIGCRAGHSFSIATSFPDGSFSNLW